MNQNTHLDSNEASSSAHSPRQESDSADPSQSDTEHPRLGDQLREGGRELLESGKQRLVGNIAVYESAVLDASSRLREEQHPVLARQLESAADSVGRVKHYLGERSNEELLGEAGEFCRRHPAACFAGAFLAGLTAARFFKAGTPRTDDAEGDVAEYD